MSLKDILVNGVVVGSINATGDNIEDAKAVRKYLKDHGIDDKPVSENDSMYGQANSFAKVAIDLYESGLSKSPYNGAVVAPFVVNAAFSIELYLKTIHNALGNNIKGHHLLSLYKGMPKKGKAHFLEAADAVRPHYNLPEGEDIFSCLERLNKAFEIWRYLYEHNEIGLEVQSVRYTMHTSNEACCRVRDEIHAET